MSSFHISFLSASALGIFCYPMHYMMLLKFMSVDALEQCSEMIGKDDNRTIKANRHANGSSKISTFHYGGRKTYFPFRQNDLFVATLRVGLEGIQMTVDGKHVTSFAFREVLTLSLPSHTNTHCYRQTGRNHMY